MRDTQQFIRGQIYWRKADRWDDTDAGIIGKDRPVLIVSNNVGLACSTVATVVPLTTSERKNQLCTQVQITLNGKENYILCEQIYTCNLSELQRYIGTLNEHRMAEVEEAIMYALGMKALPSTKFEESSESSSMIESTVTKESKSVALSTDSSAVRPVTDNASKLQLIEDYGRYKRKILTIDRLLERYPYKNLGSLQSAVRRYRRQLGVKK